MPDDSRVSGSALDFTVQLSGTWMDRPRSGAARLRLAEMALEVTPAGGDPIVAPYASLSGASFRAASLTLHAAAGEMRLDADTGLDRAWVLLVARACPVPEFTRGLRALGSRRGGDAAAQVRFFAPLLQARRRLEEEADVERRLEVFSAPDLMERMRQTVAALATEWYPHTGPDHRALEAELLDALDALFARFEALGTSASRFREAPEAARFDHWRHWLGEVAGVFADADAGWSAAVRCLPQRPPVERGRSRRGRGRGHIAPLLALAVSLGAALGGRFS